MLLSVRLADPKLLGLGGSSGLKLPELTSQVIQKFAGLTKLLLFPMKS
jgi:hypothetical protein